MNKKKYNIIKSQMILYEVTYRTLAPIFGVSERTISRWITGEVPITHVNMVRLCNLLHMTDEQRNEIMK